MDLHKGWKEILQYYLPNFSSELLPQMPFYYKKKWKGKGPKFHFLFYHAGNITEKVHILKKNYTRTKTEHEQINWRPTCAAVGATGLG